MIRAGTATRKPNAFTSGIVEGNIIEGAGKGRVEVRRARGLPPSTKRQDERLSEEGC